jgi:hypothetical protein
MHARIAGRTVTRKRGAPARESEDWNRKHRLKLLPQHTCAKFKPGNLVETT